MAKKKQLGTQPGSDSATGPQSNAAGTQPSGKNEQTKPSAHKKTQDNTPQSEIDSVSAFAQSQQQPVQDEKNSLQSFAALAKGRDAVKKMAPAQQMHVQKELPPIQTQNDGEVKDALGARSPIGTEEVRSAMRVLEEYKAGKVNLDEQHIRNEEWYRMQHWELLRQQAGQLEPVSGWLFNAIAAKHADAMDNFPTCNILPREQEDEQAADVLSEIIPCVLERNRYEQAYSDGWWDKLKHGMSAYGIFWDKDINDGEGDIVVRHIDTLKIFWQPGITDLQQSRNLFIVDFVHRDQLKELYPDLDTETLSNTRDFRQYIQQDYADNKDMIPVIDWYYKKLRNGKTVLHYCKFVEDHVLFATENEQGYENGLYDHGMYPLVFDVMYPEAGTVYGFGIISIAKDNQMYIDQLYKDIMENAEVSAKPRYWASEQSIIDEKEFLDTKNTIVHVGGSIDESKLKPIEAPTMPSFVLNILQQKIDELKETTSNRDVNSGTTASGVTAASAISALQEAGNKNSRDIIEGGYRAFQDICTQIVELIRQFYTEERSFRVSGKGGKSEFLSFSNQMMADRQLPEAYPGQNEESGIALKRPVYDIKISAEKRSPYQRLSQNTFIMELYGNGFFAPENAQASLAALEAMEFEGKDDIIAKVQEGQTLLNVVQQLQMQMAQMQQALAAMSGVSMGKSQQQDSAEPTAKGGNSEGGRALRAQTANSSEQTSTKQETIRANAPADINRGGERTSPK